MRRLSTRLAAGCALVVAMTFCAGAALAGNGTGNENAPGQVKQEQASAQVQATTQAQAQTQVQAPTESKGKADGHDNAQAKVSASVNTTAGMKSSSTTAKWTKCGPTGGTSASATCLPEDGRVSVLANADVSKRYGNDMTAAQIAVSRGGAGKAHLTGPGNSQPHKVAVCPHKSNHSGGVDVHAVKSYSTTACATSTPSVKPTVERQKTSKTEVTAQAQTQAQVTANTRAQTQAAAQQQPVTANATVQAQTQAQQASAASPGNKKKGGVLGAQTKVQKPSSQGGVLGKVGNVSGSSLPFTGLPVWLVLLISAALAVTGFGLYRRANALRV